jgi:hypothetical protein
VFITLIEHSDQTLSTSCHIREVPFIKSIGQYEEVDSKTLPKRSYDVALGLGFGLEVELERLRA